MQLFEGKTWGFVLYTILIPWRTILPLLPFLAMNRLSFTPFPQPAGKAHVVSGVIQGLLQGRWRGGERLTEAAVAQIFSVSRTPVREAFLELAGMGMIQLRRNCGAVLQPFGPRQLSEIYAVRSLLETEAARLAAERVPPAQLDSLRLEFERLRDENRPDEGWKLDKLLHSTIATHSGNVRLAEEINRYTLLIQTMRETAGRLLSGLQPASINEHLEILDRIGQGDGPGAGAAMRKHLLQAEQSALSAIQALHAASP
jgi:DNA-binding GntR family transcriptional regulator